MNFRRKLTSKLAIIATLVVIASLMIALVAIPAGALTQKPALPGGDEVLNSPDPVAIPAMINYQGYLTDSGGNPINDTLEITFSIYNAPTGTKPPLWTETQSVTVTNGIFYALLGSINPIDINDLTGVSYLGIKVGSDPEMTPRQRMVSVAYAFHADKANDADTLDGLDSADFVAVAGDTMTGQLVLPADGLAVGTDQLVLTGGKVGIGTTSPGYKLDVGSTSDSFNYARIGSSNWGGILLYDGIGTHSGGVIYYHGDDSLQFQTRISGGNPTEKMRITSNGNTGIGTGTPANKLDVEGGMAVGTAYSGTWAAPVNGMIVEGKVGIGMTNPVYKLDVQGGLYYAISGTSSGDIGVHGEGYNYGIYGESSSGTGVLGINQSTGNYGKLGTSTCGVYGESGGAGSYAAAFKGNVLIRSRSTGENVIELGEGLDYAEGFDVADSAMIVPGSVLIIDPNNPGKLTISNSPYDTKVAGIVAGAKEMGSGVRLGSGHFDYDVALAGRVYCNVDATYGKVSPGDLLTTSPTPGYAMVVRDYEKSQGAILGKAMEGLPEGEKGQILVLVTLQ